MKQQKIKFTIGQDGSVTEEVINVSGGECLHLTKSIESKLGSLETREFKSEFYNKHKNVTFQYDQNTDQTQT